MLKAGLFTTPKASYNLFEVSESGFYRIDFVRDGGTFMYDVDKVAYSLYKKKGTFTFGDRSIYEDYERILATFTQAHFDTKTESRWNGGKYYKYITGQNTKLGYTSQVTQENGITTECTLVGGGYSISWGITAAIYDVAIEPMNFYEYTKTSVSKATVEEVSSGGLYYSLAELKRKYDLDYVEDNDFEVVQTVERLNYWLERYQNDPYPWRSFDTETTGTDVSMFGEDYMVGLVLGINKTTACYIPFRHTGDFNIPMSELPRIMEIVIAEQDRSTGHNVKFDEQVMRKEGFKLRLKYDTLQISIINNPVFAKLIHGLKHLTSELLHRYVLELRDIFINPKDINFAVLPPEIIKYYACPDGSNSLIILEDQLKKLPKFQRALVELECNMTHIIAEQEYFGIRVDVKKFEHQYHNCNYILDMLLKAFRILTKEDGNINSGPVMMNLLYNKMHCKVLVRTKTGQPSVAMPAIKKLAALRAEEPRKITEDLIDLDGKVIVKAADLSKAAYPALLILAKYREYNKLKTAFYARFERTMKTGRVFFWVNQNGAATGRQSSPMHQLPPALKDCILADAEDRDFWGPDFSQVELRMIAYLAGEKDLIEKAKDPRNDIHRIIGSLITGKEMWEITPQERNVGKRRNFGVVYLISAMGLAAQIFGAGYTAENVEFCQEQLDAFFNRFKRINRYIKQNGVKVQRDGYMETAWFHRRRMFPEIFDPDLEPRKRASIIRMSNNVPVQGTAADLLKFGMVTMDKYIHDRGWDQEMEDGYPKVRMMLSIHDELIISAHQSLPFEEIIRMITLCMDVTVKDAPPFFVQPARMDNWGGHSDDAVAIPIPYRDQLIADYEKTGISVFKQSYFRLQVPQDVSTAISQSPRPIAELCKEYLPKVSMVFERGNYVQEYTEKQLKTAFMRYLESGFTLYCIDNYLDKLNAYRDTELESYMNGLIKQYGTDYKVVGEHVRDGALTFELLARYKKVMPKDMEHVASITEATRLYIEGLSEESKNKIIATEEVTVNKVSDKDLFTEQLEALVNYDENGEVVFEDASDEFEDAYSYYNDDDEDYAVRFAENKPVYVWEIGDSILFDVEKFKTEDINAILAYIYKYQRSDGFYHTYILYGDKMRDTTIRVENFDIDAANDLLCKIAERNIA